MPLRPSALAVFASLILLAACDPSQSPPASSPAGETAGAARPAEALRGRVAAHWFGRQWPKNYLPGFRREHVAEDFRALAQDGFDTVVLLVAWGDFQPVYAPCCGYDERAFERLRFLLERADEAGLDVMLRLGYGWSFHPQAGDVGERQRRVLNDPAARAAFGRFLERVSAEISGHNNVSMGFMSWEDLWLRQVDEVAADTYAEYLATLPPDPARPQGLPDATRDARLFHGYWDWLVIEKLLGPAVPLFPALSFEARIDSEPRFEPGPDGAPVVAEWIAHDGMMRMPEGHPLTIYWAPFWGALNRGEQLPAARSLELLDLLLRQSAGKSGRPLFIDQFNFVDNTPGHEHNAVIRPEETPAFLHAAVCTMKRHDVLGYAIWTARDYAESPLHNPAFGYGLEGWRLERAAGAPEQALQALTSGDFQLRLADGDRLSQQVPHRHGRMPRAGDALPDRVCVEAEVSAPGMLEARAGGEPVMLTFETAGRQRRCADISPQPDDEGLAFSLQLRGGALALRETMIFDHVQYGGLYDLEGRPGPLREPVRRMNRDFRSDPARCAERQSTPAMNRHGAIPFLVACLGIAAFTAMDAIMKGLSIAIGVYNAMLWRMLAGSVMGGLVFFALRSSWPTRPVLRLHLLRSAIVTVMAVAFFWGLVRVPLAEGIAITFVAPLIALYLARLILDEDIGRAAIFASLLALAGVLTIVGGKLRFDRTAEALPGLASLFFSAVLYAWNLILQRRQAQLATPIEIAFFQNLFVLLLLAVPAPFLAVVPSPLHLPEIVGSAALALVALGLLAWAYARAEAQVLLTVEYTAFIWAAALGWVLFGETLSAATLLGTALIVAGCIMANYRSHRPPTHVETTAL